MPPVKRTPRSFGGSLVVGAQLLNSTDPLIDAWTEIDASAQFDTGIIPESIMALVILGSALDSETVGLAEIKFRASGDATDYEDAVGFSASGVIMDAPIDYAKGGAAIIMDIPVSTDGKFEYQLRNAASSPRNIVKILGATTSVQSVTVPVRALFSDFATAGLNNTIDLLTLPIGAVVESVIAVVVTPMSGGGVASYTVECGQDVTPDTDAFLTAQSAMAAANTIYGGADAHVGVDLDSAANAIYSVTATFKVRAKAIADVNLDLVTAGTVDFYITFRRLALP